MRISIRGVNGTRRAARTSWVAAVALATAVPAAAAIVRPAAAAPPATRAPAAAVRVSAGHDGRPTDAGSERLSISGDGTRVVFTTRAGNVVRGLHDGLNHVYLRDLRSGRVTVVDVGNAGRPADGASWEASLSSDGNYVTFFSDATNLAPGTAGRHSHIYVRDLRRHRTTIEDVTTAGVPSDRDSIQSQISADGAAVVFMSRGTNLVPGAGVDDWNVFLRDRRSGAVRLVSTGPDGKAAHGVSYGPSVSADHRFVSFASLAGNLVTDDTNGVGDVFVRDLRTGTVALVSVGDDGTRGDDLAVGSSISGDGRYVGFSSHATNIAPGLPTDHSSHSFVRDLRAGRTIAVDVNASGAVGNGGSTWTGLSAGGTHAVFQSQATNLVAGVPVKRWNVYRRDLRTGEVVLASATSAQTQSNGENWWPTTSADGSLVGFLSFGDDIAPGDTNGVSDAYVRRLDPGGRSAAPVAGPAPVAAAADPAPANRNQWLTSSARTTVTPAGGRTGDLVASGSSYVYVPYLNYYASFTQNTSKVAWLGTSPAVADSVRHTDTWHIDFFGGPYQASGAPEGAVVTTDAGSVDVAWTTTENQAWQSRHDWSRLDISPPSYFGQIYRIRHTVTGTFQFGSAFYSVSSDGRSFVW